MLVWFRSSYSEAKFRLRLRLKRMKLIKGAILLFRREMRQQIPVELTHIVRCCIMTKQLLHHDKAIAASRCINQLNRIPLATKLMKQDDEKSNVNLDSCASLRIFNAISCNILRSYAYNII